MAFFVLAANGTVLKYALLRVREAKSYKTMCQSPSMVYRSNVCVCVFFNINVSVDTRSLQALSGCISCLVEGLSCRVDTCSNHRNVSRISPCYHHFCLSSLLLPDF